LPDPKDQVALADEVIKKDLTVDQLKALVDQKAGPRNSAPAKGKGPKAAKEQPTPPPDPLAEVWPPLHANGDFSPDVHWEVHYGAHEVGKGQSVNGWFFSALPNEGVSAKPAWRFGLSRCHKLLRAAQWRQCIGGRRQMQESTRSLPTRRPKTPAGHL